ncbi:MAG: Asp-tRNA(Asn)/Glu-tRNA(Gln) amidotransferase subunit GatB [Candidatus Daviesbacteria bacterium]|nr:Asp-tRNA(Asn)/Glu-tRNA(Gln) amidotransferase subunit GatB [Candidatus Daviesbacteria bacterium]
MKYEPVIGLEVHVELNTKSKMFCKCSADYFGKEPNTHTCSVCLGLPGALPYINEKAIESCMKIGLALNCSINKLSRFERKNYFYPDLPKGYQISQYRWPLCVGGWMEIEGTDGVRRIRVNRVHQEEDTAKLSHLRGGTEIDFNRSSVPLVEIVTEPDFHDSSEVRDFAKKLQQLFRYLGVSNADMERGDMRLEANVSVRPEHAEGLPPYRIELKNINSFRFMVAAIEYEIKRQTEALGKGEKLTQETRGWDQDKKETYLQRSKEEAHDYRYFPDPDLPEISLQSSAISLQQLKDKIPELPWDKEERFVTEYGLSKDNAKILAESHELAVFYESNVKLGKQQNIEAKQIANYIINQKLDIDKTSPDQVLKEISSKSTGIIGDEVELKKLVQEAIKEKPESVAVYKAGKLGALNVLLGAVMKKTSGKADIEKVKEILLLEIGIH